MTTEKDATGKKPFVEYVAQRELFSSPDVVHITHYPEHPLALDQRVIAPTPSAWHMESFVAIQIVSPYLHIPYMDGVGALVLLTYDQTYALPSTSIPVVAEVTKAGIPVFGLALQTFTAQSFDSGYSLIPPFFSPQPLQAGLVPLQGVPSTFSESIESAFECFSYDPIIQERMTIAVNLGGNKDASLPIGAYFQLHFQHELDAAIQAGKNKEELTVYMRREFSSPRFNQHLDEAMKALPR
jgi:hypothetical protein